MKKCSASLAVSEEQIKTGMQFNFTLRDGYKQKTDNNKC